jgi:hypothetical protein
MRIYIFPLRNDAAQRTWSSVYRISFFSAGRLESAHIPSLIWVQNALNLNREPANGSGLDTSGAVAFAAAVAVEVILRIGLAALSLPLPDILGLSSYFVIEDGQSITLGYTAGYLLIGLEPIRLCAYVVQVLRGRREAVVIRTVDLTMLSVFMS